LPPKGRDACYVAVQTPPTLRAIERGSGRWASEPGPIPCS
jgi:hypothetical protein